MDFKNWLIKIEMFGPAHTGGIEPPQQRPDLMAQSGAMPRVQPKKDSTRNTDMPPDKEEQFGKVKKKRF
jgi:hypothetical protein